MIGLSAACRAFMAGGPLRWVRNRVTVAEISDWQVLRSRIIEARGHPEAISLEKQIAASSGWTRPFSTVLWWGNKFPLRGPLIKYYRQSAHTTEVLRKIAKGKNKTAR